MRFANINLGRGSLDRQADTGEQESCWWSWKAWKGELWNEQRPFSPCSGTSISPPYLRRLLAGPPAPRSLSTVQPAWPHRTPHPLCQAPWHPLTLRTNPGSLRSHLRSGPSLPPQPHLLLHLLRCLALDILMWAFHKHPDVLPPQDLCPLNCSLWPESSLPGLSKSAFFLLFQPHLKRSILNDTFPNHPD